MKLSRRTFFKVNAAGAAALVAAPRSASAATAVASPHARGVLVDTTRCIGCRACEAACAEANDLDEPAGAGDDVVFARTRDTDQRTFTVVNRVPAAAARPQAVPIRFVKKQCMHCVDPACVSACPARALEKSPEGPVTYTGGRCLGCRYCMVACPFDGPRFEYDKAQPYVRKCTFCAPRQARGLPPACTEVCPTGALQFGTRTELLEEARTRIYQNPGRYVRHIYGEHEAGGTSWLYISDVPLESLGLKAGLRNAPYPELTATALSAVPVVMTLWPPLLMGLYTFTHRREAVAAAEHAHEAGPAIEGDDHA
jgi:Fe-S-cluster-containing dehydrogenase component